MDGWIDGCAADQLYLNSKCERLYKSELLRGLSLKLVSQYSRSLYCHYAGITKFCMIFLGLRLVSRSEAGLLV